MHVTVYPAANQRVAQGSLDYNCRACDWPAGRQWILSATHGCLCNANSSACRWQERTTDGILSQTVLSTLADAEGNSPLSALLSPLFLLSAAAPSQAPNCLSPDHHELAELAELGSCVQGMPSRCRSSVRVLLRNPLPLWAALAPIRRLIIVAMTRFRGPLETNDDSSPLRDPQVCADRFHLFIILPVANCRNLKLGYLAPNHFVQRRPLVQSPRSTQSSCVFRIIRGSFFLYSLNVGP